jgi:uncharacterized membrane protein YfcA
MSEAEYFFLPVIVLLAFILKGITGTGTSTVIVALSSLIIDAKSAIVLASFINVFGGLSMARIDPVPLKSRYWIPIAVVMIAGSVVGAALLKMIPKEYFQLLLGNVFLLMSGYFLKGAPKAAGRDTTPDKATTADLGVGLFAGFCGGFVGINAPPLVLHFSRYLDKRLLRRLLVLIFIPAAIAQTATFAYNGLLTSKIAVFGLYSIPAMLLGIYIGNKSFHKVSELQFRKILAVLLFFVSAYMIWQGYQSF